MNMETGSQLMRRATVEEIVAGRNRTLTRYDEAHAALLAASNAVGKARNSLTALLPGRETSYNMHMGETKGHFHASLKIPDLAEYMATARRIVDTETWSWIIEHTDLERLMDKQAKDAMRQELMAEPPEVTVENIVATLERFIVDADLIFKRGIANVFSALDRRFKSHDGWKIGSRVILSYAFDEWGSWNYSRNHEDSMMDIERVFRILDDNKADYCELTSTLRQARSGGQGRRQTEFETSYFRLRAFKNGNAHIWFQRDDLVEKVNKLLGEYYAHPIPTDRDHEAAHAEHDLNDAKTLPARRYAFFPTPEPAAEKLLERVGFTQRKEDPALRCLEPQAGTGNLARRMVEKMSKAGWRADQAKGYRFDGTVDCVEIEGARAAALQSERIYGKVYCIDFLKLSPETTGLYDRIVMNPPFDRERDVDHVVHAMKFLKPDGSLHAIMSAGTEFRETRKSIAFREMIEKLGGHYSDLPPGSFADAGTYCNTIILRVNKNGSKIYRW